MNSTDTKTVSVTRLSFTLNEAAHQWLAPLLDAQGCSNGKYARLRAALRD